MNAIIIDDEPGSHTTLAALIHENHPEIDLVGNAYNVKSGIELIEQTQPQILFVDIEMPDGTGFDLLEQIDFSKYSIIFITAHNDYAVTAFQFMALAYLIKPVGPSELAFAVDRAKQYQVMRSYQERLNDFQELLKNYRQQKLPERLVVSNTQGTHYIPVCEILYLKVNEGCIEIYQQNQSRPIMVSANLVEYERRFKLYPQFFRIHRSYLVNLDHARSVRGDGTLVLAPKNLLPVSARNLESLRDRLKSL